MQVVGGEMFVGLDADGVHAHAVNRAVADGDVMKNRAQCFSRAFVVVVRGD